MRDDERTTTDVQSDTNEVMIRAERTCAITSLCKEKKTLACTRRISDLVTECVWIVDSKRACVTAEPNSVVVKSYATEFDIKQAFWHRFPSSGSTGLTNGESGEDQLECLCLVGDESIDMYSTIDDHYYTCSVPFKLTGVHQSSHGLILERALRDKRLFTPPPDYFMPRLFSLSHPYDEALPVLCSQKGQSRLVYCWEGDTEVEIVGTSEDLVLVFDPTLSTHRLYAIRSNEEDTKRVEEGAHQLATPRINPERVGANLATHTPVAAAQLQQQQLPPSSRRPGGPAAPNSAVLQQSATHRRMRSLLGGCPLASPITPTLNGGGGGQMGGGGAMPFSAKFTPNRSMQSMGESSPFVRLARLPATSTPLSRLQEGVAAAAAAGAAAPAAVTPVMQQGGGGGAATAAALRTKRALSVPPRQPSEEEEDEALISSIWMELIWTEREPAKERATKFFISRDMTLTTYANWLVGQELFVMKVTMGGGSGSILPSLICPPSSTPAVIAARGAEYVKNSRLTATISPDETSVVMYSGVARVGVVVMKMTLPSPCRLTLLAAAERTMTVGATSTTPTTSKTGKAVGKTGGKMGPIEMLRGEGEGGGEEMAVVHVRLPALFRSQFAGRLWESLADSLSTSSEKMSRILAVWTAMNRERMTDGPAEVAALSRLILEHAGVAVEEMEPEIERVLDEDMGFESEASAHSGMEEEDEPMEMEEMPSEEEMHRVIIRMTRKQRQSVTVRRVLRIIKKESEKAAAAVHTMEMSGISPGKGARPSLSEDSLGEKRKNEEGGRGEDTMGAKQSRSEEGMEEDEQWRLICDVLQASNGVFPRVNNQTAKEPLRSSGVKLRLSSMDEDTGKRTELTARTPSPLWPYGKEKKPAPLSSWSRAAALCRRAREAAWRETADAAVKRRRRRMLLTGRGAGAAGAAGGEEAPLANIANLVFQSLHLSYEESKMHMGEYAMLRVLALHLFIFARWRSLTAYANYYARDFPFLREIKVLTRPSPDAPELTLIPPLPDSTRVEGQEEEEEDREERKQVAGWDRCVLRTPSERRGGAYGGLLQLRRAAAAGAAAAGAITPTSSLFTPPTGAVRGQVLQPPANAALAAFSPTAVPSVSEYLARLLQLAGHTSSMSIYESLLEDTEAARREMAELDTGGCSGESAEGELVQQLLREAGMSCSSGVTASPSFCGEGGAGGGGLWGRGGAMMLCSPLPPQVSSGSFSLAPAASPLASGLFLAVGVGLGLIRSTGDLVRMLSSGWARRLRISGEEEVQREIVEAVNDREADEMTRCDRVFSALGWTRETVSNLNPTMKVLVASITNKSRPFRPSIFFGKTEQPAGLADFPSSAELFSIMRKRWPHDQRSENSLAMMDSFRPVFIPPIPRPAPSHVTPGQYDQAAMDAEIRERQEAFLAAVNQRTYAQAFGRAIMNYRTVLPVPNNTLLVREIVTAGRTPPTNMQIEVTAGAEQIKVLREWADFYQGVSVGLTVVPTDVMETDSDWLTQSYGQDKNASLSGLLYAFGLNGHIKKLNMYYVHEHLTNQDKLTSIALLLGLSAAHMGTGDTQVHKILVTHLPFLMGPTLLEIHVEGVLQIAAVAGLGLLFAQSGRTNMIDQLINELGREQDAHTEMPTVDRYAYGLTCGMAIGMIGLGMGKEIAVNNVPLAQSTRAIADRLIVLMGGGSRTDAVFLPRTGEAASSIGVHGLMPEQLSTTTGAMAAPPHHPSHPGHNQIVGGPAVPSSHVKEDPDLVNVHITGHGAIVALALLFLKSGDREIASALTLPNTIYDIEGIRPDMIIPRVMAKALVEWDQIAPTQDWLLRQVPPVIRKYEAMLIRMEDETFAPTREWKRYWENLVDRETVAQTYLYCMAGALFSMAVKYPSSSHPGVAALCHHWVEVLMPRRESSARRQGFVSSASSMENTKREGYSRMCRLAGQSCVSDCLNQIALALAVLHAGTGDLQALRVFRALRMGGGGDPLKWASEVMNMHSQQAAAHTALGLLFAGNGRCGLKNDDRSLALLIVSLYPISCGHVADNKMYLQPLRFLWSQCLEPRLLYSVSTYGTPTSHWMRYEWALEKAKEWRVDEEGKERLVEVEETHAELRPVKSKAPIVLPPLDMLSWVSVGGDSIDNIKFDMRNPEDRAALERILRVQHGRIALKIVDAQANLVEAALAACNAHPLRPLGSAAAIRRAAEAEAAIEFPRIQLGPDGSPVVQPKYEPLPRQPADERWSEKTILAPSRNKLNELLKAVQPAGSEPFHLCGAGNLAATATTEITDLTTRWCMESGSFEGKSNVLSVYKRLLTEDMSESALAYNEATLLCRVLEGKEKTTMNEIRLVSLMEEIVSRKVEDEARPRNLIRENYRLKTKDCVDPTLFQIL